MATRQYNGENSLKAMPQTLTLDHVSPATRLLEKRRQMFEVQEALDAQKQLYIAKEEAFRLREEALRKKDLELQENLLKFKKFLQENESKKNRAEKRARDEEKQRLVKEAEIVKLKAELQRQQEHKVEMEQKAENLRKYQEYLHRVVDSATEEYSEIQDLLSRHRTLQDANSDLSHNQWETESSLEATRNDLTRYVKELENDNLNFNNELATLRDELAATKHEVARDRLHEEEGLHDVANERKELFQVLLSVENLLRRCQAKKKIKKAESAGGRLGGGITFADLGRIGEDSMVSLEEVAMYMVDYQDIVEEWFRGQAQVVRHSETEGSESEAKRTVSGGGGGGGAADGIAMPKGGAFSVDAK
mmetsp:Transcript_13740/g.40615  ORF Transcript_13740/g.40615 Transcript_13740/m.40615 type:complete len:362 (-) Transcript_13740:1254-2339(-)